MSETVLEEYGFKASMMAPGQMQAAERMAAECATLRARVAELEAERGTLPDGAHPDEAKPRAETWLAERANWTAEVERIRAWVAVLETQLATTRARHIREAVEGVSDERFTALEQALLLAVTIRLASRQIPESAASADTVARSAIRAALLDALGGTTPPLDETGGKA